MESSAYTSHDLPFRETKSFNHFLLRTAVEYGSAVHLWVVHRWHRACADDSIRELKLSIQRPSEGSKDVVAIPHLADLRARDR